MSVEVRPVRTYDVLAHYVATHMRHEDVEELRLLSRTTPQAALKQSIEMSDEAYVAVADGKPAAVFGAHVPVLGRRGVPWMLGTRGVDRNRQSLLQFGRAFTDHLMRRCDRLDNVALAANRRSLVMLARIGFEIGDPFEVREGVCAVQFWKERRHV